MASTTSAAQIPMPQHRYPFLEIRSLSQSITFACSSPQDSGSALVPMSLFMSFSLIPITVTADQIGTVQFLTFNVFRKFSKKTIITTAYSPDVGPFSQITEACTELAEIPSFCAMKYWNLQLSKNVPSPTTRCGGKPESFMAAYDRMSTETTRRYARHFRARKKNK